MEDRFVCMSGSAESGECSILGASQALCEIACGVQSDHRPPMLNP